MASLAYGGAPSSNAGQLIYWWSGETYTFVSGLVIPNNQWSFVAVVIEPTVATLYLGSGGTLNTATDFTTHTSEALGENGQIGHQQGLQPDDRVFNGSIDEVALFNYAFTGAQVTNLYRAAFGPSSVSLDIQRIGANVQLTWPQGTLLEATNLSGPYTTNGNSSPYIFAPTAAQKFFRVRVQ